ncbi:hypothetical protein Godav_014073 [Gossypium davidsonii]|uniref:Oligopeptidase A N-terminal domain-containing protein n=2 Tax=Gossypium TaxID=3633 RepID=A0A7J8RJH3_GOSDV|nr:hypothetical protein [Gossypium davidsonii]MBA0648863.1 hypothetical protein [Gossypium klotzschianum]
MNPRYFDPTGFEAIWLGSYSPEKVKFQLRLGQSKPIYNAFKAIKESLDWQSLNEAYKHILDANLQELVRLSHKFSENFLDATKKFEKMIIDKKEIDGLPATTLGLAAQTTVSKEVYRAYITRASTSDLDNAPIINQILKLRSEKAKLLNYNIYAKLYHRLCYRPKNLCRWFTDESDFGVHEKPNNQADSRRLIFRVL